MNTHDMLTYVLMQSALQLGMKDQDLLKFLWETTRDMENRCALKEAERILQQAAKGVMK